MEKLGAGETKALDPIQVRCSMHEPWLGYRAFNG